jgi:hypothetical protein
MVQGSNPGRGENFCTCPDRPWGPPSLLYNGYRIFPGVKSGRGVMLTPYPLLVLWSWNSRAMPLLPLSAVRPVQSFSACTRVHFILILFMEPKVHYRLTSVHQCSKPDKSTPNNQPYFLNQFNPLKSELNPICHLLALVGAHPIFHISRIRVKYHPPTYDHDTHAAVIIP